MAAVLSAPLPTFGQRTPPACSKWDACRELALEAESRGEFERFHDLAWRTMQTRGRTDPEVMRLLARAQARSGRPHDALVMLRRITELKIAPAEALEEEAFARTRSLPDWPQLRDAIARLSTESSSVPEAAARPVEPRRAVEPKTAPADAALMESAAPAPGAAAAGPAPQAAAAAGFEAEDVVSFAARGLTPAGLAYDSASARILVGDREGRRVISISERLKTSVDLVRAASAGFHEVQALVIDDRQGDLWVASATADTQGSSMAPESASAPPPAALHKLQLVSGRPLETFAIDAGDRPAQVTGLAVSPDGTVFVLDGAGGRLWTLAPRQTKPALAATIDVQGARALAVDGQGRHAFVAHEGGLLRLTLETGRVTPVASPDDLNPARIERLAWHRGRLLAIEGAGHTRRLLRLGLTRQGTAVARLEVIDPDVRACGNPGALVSSGDSAYYLAEASSDAPSGGCTLVVKRLKLP